MNRRLRLLVAAHVPVVIGCSGWSVAVPAFPGATGPGAIATGGRGGDVYHVTNLDPDKAGVVPGSFQYGINTAPPSGRTIVFDVGGTIYLNGLSANDTLRFNRSNITVAGQTAPGPGITIAGTGTKWTGTNNIVRNISIRPNRNANNVTFDAFSLQTKNSIFDHVSATWFTDEGISITDAGERSTVQYAVISEGLNYDAHGFGSIIATEVDGTHYSFNHNLYAHNFSRMPAVGSETGQIGAIVEFANNVLYNWGSTKVGYSATNQPSSTNIVNNYYINGYNNRTTNLFVGGDDPANAGFSKIHESGNKLDSDRDTVIDGVTVGGSTYFRGGLTRYAQPFDVDGAAVPDTADAALERTLAYGGANWWNRSPIDQRIVDSVRTVSGRIVNDLSSSPHASEWAALMAQRPDAQGVAPFVRPAGWDTDRDGMPDAWEERHGLNPAVANHNDDFDADGYTDLEEYLNELAAWPAPKAIHFTGADGARYAISSNWDIDWQPSRFDTAVLSGGTVIVDAVGQHAGSLLVGTSAGDAELAVNAGWLEANVVRVGDGGVGVVSLNQTAGTGGELRVATLIRVDENSTLAFDGGSLVLSDAGIFDYAGQASPLATLRQQLDAGRSGGAGIVFAGAADHPHVGVGIAEASVLGWSQFAGESIDSSTVLLRVTLLGDTDLDRDVDFSDLTAFARHYNNSPGATWTDGDFDYDGAVGFSDRILLARNFDSSMIGASATPPGMSAADMSLALSLIPEPASLAALMACGLLSARRRR